MRRAGSLKRFQQILLGAILLAAMSMLSRDGVAQEKAAKKAQVFKDKIAVDSDIPLAVAYSPRGSAVAAAGFRGDVKIWDPRTGEFRLTIPSPDRKTKRALAFAPDGGTLAVAGDDHAIRLFDVRTGAPGQTLAGHKGFFTAIIYSPDGRLLASAAIETGIRNGMQEGKHTSEIRLWDPMSGKCMQSWIAPDNRLVSSLAFSPDGKSLASAEGAVCIRDVGTGEVTQTLKPARGVVMAIAFSPDGKRLAGGGGYGVTVEGGTKGAGELQIWDVATGDLPIPKADLPGAIHCIAFSADGRVLATGSSGSIRQERTRGWLPSELRCWDAQTGDVLRTVEGPLGRAASLAFSPDGRMILWCDSLEVILTETSTGLRRATIMKVAERLMK